ncbi:YdcF family protein [Ancylobacter pratisalsi]|uniref:YdcF family protein n=1 Tax=Ancylobacter pratisalsi TaxID=1745854 RepID=A0A6P1YHA2_9HYPH|nr:YdcF family protein [Ancylobacter pratisalsi]QIB32340.1 YdcF family protein [Ancylobacter pratisalsi]
MFFYASKIMWMVSVPSTFLTLLALVGLAMMPRFRRFGMALMALGVIGLAVAGLSPLGRVLMHELEQRFPPFDDAGPITGVVVLGGAELPELTASRGQPSFNNASERLLALVELAHRYPDAKIVFAGGSGALMGQTMQEADVVRMALHQLGVDPARVIFEARSRNTAENARNARDLVKPRPKERWLLVTSAAHMPRAIGCFRVAGFPVTAYPVDFRTTATLTYGLFGNVAEGLDFVDGAVREWIGLVVYYWTGRTDAWFPAP